MPEGTVDFLVVFQGVMDDDETLGDEWYWQGRSNNGQIVTRGESHPNYNNALRAARGAHPHLPVFKMSADGEKVPVGVHATDRYSEIKAMLGIPDSEPIFILRGQDKLAARTVRSYKGHARNEILDAEDDYDEVPDNWTPPIPEEWFVEIQEEVDRFLLFAEQNPDKMKLPD